MAHLILWNSFGTNFAPVRPLGAHQLASWLTNFNYRVKVIDFCNLMTTEQLVKLTEQHIDKDTIAIGASTTFWKDRNDPLGEPNWCISARSILEEKYSKIDWVLGGYQTSKDFETKDWIKFKGPAEDTFLKFLDQRVGHVLSRKLFDIKTLDKHYLDNLNIQPSEVLPIEMSRGCQFKCSFCRYPFIGKKKGTYLRDTKLIRDELLFNYERYGTTRYSIVDDTVNEDDDKIKALADIAQTLPFRIEWLGYLRLDLIGSRRHMIPILKESGLKGAYFGIESFHKEASKVVGKGWNGVHAKDFLLELREEWNNSVAFQLGLIAGLPGESMSDLESTLNWCIENKIDNWNFQPLHIDRGDNRPFRSEFDINYASYGYSFPDPNDDEFWINDLWTRKTATDAALALDKIADPHLNVSVWRGASYASLGYELKSLYKTKVNDMNYKELFGKTKSFVLDYVNRSYS